jgi:predicted O-methyltransferase YrrM
MTDREFLPPFDPDMLPRAWHMISLFLAFSPQKRVLHVGANRNTLWLAHNRVTINGSVVGVTPCPRRRLRLEASVNSIERSIRDVRFYTIHDDNLPAMIRQLPDAGYDLVMVDPPLRLRIPCLMEAKPKVRPGGVIALEDSHVQECGPVRLDIGGWRFQEVSGECLSPVTGLTTWRRSAFFVRPKR